MLPIEPEIAGVNITMVGSFNPLIFTPDWMARNGIITDQMASAANVQIVHPDVSAIDLDWFVVRVDKDRFHAQTREASLVRLSDAVQMMFGVILPHTPIWQLGISRWLHFSAGTMEIRNEIGRALAPVEPWGEWGMQIAARRDEWSSGMSTLVMEEKQPGEDPFTDYIIAATVQPSLKMRVGVGIFMSVQHTHKLKTGDKTVGCLDVVTKLGSSFEGTIAKSESIISGIMSLKAKFSS